MSHTRVMSVIPVEEFLRVNVTDTGLLYLNVSVRTRFFLAFYEVSHSLFLILTVDPGSEPSLSKLLTLMYQTSNMTPNITGVTHLREILHVFRIYLSRILR